MNDMKQSKTGENKTGSLRDALKKKVHIEGKCPNRGVGGKKKMSNFPT